MKETRQLIIELINSHKKADQQKTCREIILSVTEIADLALCARHGLLKPYKYACYFHDKTPRHINPNKIDFEAIRDRNAELKKALTKLWQLGQERRHIACHMLYTECHKYWHLFYFYQRDISLHQNHWKHGAHIHYVSDLYCSLTASEAWGKAQRGDLNFSSKEHIRFLYSSNVAECNGPDEIETNVLWPKLRHKANQQ